MKQGRKVLVIDTSVILYDSDSLTAFRGNDVVLPAVVLEELDRFKDRQGTVGDNARRANRFLDSLRSAGSLAQGVKVPEHDVNVRVTFDADGYVLPCSFDAERADNKIMAAAMVIRTARPEDDVRLVTKDINLRVKCDALGLAAEDYHRDIPSSVRKGHSRYTGQLQIHTTDEIVETLYRNGRVTHGTLQATPMHNQLVVMTGQTKSAVGMSTGHDVALMSQRSASIEGVKPRSKEQRAAFHLLLEDNVPLVTLTGVAGSGKTFLAMVAGMNGIKEKKYDRIVITRSIEPVGRDIGFLPGTVDEKMAPWIMPITDNFRNAFGDDTTVFEMMRQRGTIEVSPITYMRGRSLTKSFVIVDEAQNLTVHEIKTIVTRCGSDTKMVLLGDLDQVDTPYLDGFSNGLTVTIERLKGQTLFGHVHLDRGERSPLATLGANVL